MLRVEKILKISTPREGLDMNHPEETLLGQIHCFGKDLWETLLASQS